MNGWPLLTILTLTPVVGGLLLLGLGKDQKRLARGLALGFSVLALILAGVVWSAFDSGEGDPQLVERHAWVPNLGVEYYVGVDGLGLVMVLLTALLVPLTSPTLILSPPTLSPPTLSPPTISPCTVMSRPTK